MSSKTTKKKPEIRATEGSGNVFADLGFAHPERDLLKAQLTLQIYPMKPTTLEASAARSLRGIQ
jgi:hypothetical protein